MGTPKYTPPLSPALAKQFQALDDAAQEFFSERAGIRQFDGRQSRAAAEADAWEDTLRYLAQRNAAAHRR